jgi:hypothetical protein
MIPKQVHPNVTCIADESRYSISEVFRLSVVPDISLLFAVKCKFVAG